MHKIGILSPGKMGTTLVLSLLNPNQLFCVLDGRSQKTVDNAKKYNIKNSRTLNQIFSVCDFVFCIGSGGVAMETAKSAVANNYQGIYVDFNTLFGEQSEKELYSLTKSLNFVDAILYGWPLEDTGDQESAKRKMVLSGDCSQKVFDLFNPAIWEMSYVHDSSKRYRRVNLF